VSPVREVDNNRASAARLVKDCLNGDESAWSELIARYKNLIFSIPVRSGFSQEDAADIFQQVCMDLLTGLPGIREPNALGGWLIQVTRRRCFHRKREQLRQSADEFHDVMDEAGGTIEESVIAQAEEDQLLREALRELTPRCRELLRMLFFEKPARSYTDVARDLGLAVGSVAAIRRRCLDVLQKKLSGLGL
jgi:RNA polymerase sigma factor (sigma-70 family)